MDENETIEEQHNEEDVEKEDVEIDKERERRLHELVLDFADTGDIESYTQIYQELQEPIFCYILGILKDEEYAREAHVDTFMSVYNNIEQYKPMYKFTTWVYGIARNISFKVYNKFMKNVETPLSEAIDNIKQNIGGDYNLKNIEYLIAEVMETSPADVRCLSNVEYLINSNIPVDEISESELLMLKYQIAKDCIDELPDRHRDLIYDKYILNIKQVDLERVHGINIGTIKTRIRRATSDLKAIYKKREALIYK